MSRYREIMDYILSIPNSEEFIHTEEGRLLLAEALSHAPEEIKAKMDAKFEELGVIPKTQYVDNDGNPVFTVDQIAKANGLSEDEVKRLINRLTENPQMKKMIKSTANPLH